MALLRRLWRLDGTVGRTTYLLAGLLGFATKYAIDRAIALLVFGTDWPPLGYWRLIRLDRTPHDVSLAMFLTLFAVSIPFLWVAMAMTLLRLRDAGRSAGWAALLFVPFLNVVMFALLCLLPPRQVTPRPDRSGVLESALFAIIASVAVGAGGIAFTTDLLAMYGAGLFVAVPFSVGYLSACIHRRRHPNAPAQPFAVAGLSIVLLGGFLLAVAWEGLVCLVMAAPLALVVAILGASLGSLSAAATPRATGTHMGAVVIALPLLLLGEAAVRTEAPTFRVDSTIVIDAPIERVWNHVVTFPDITATPEWYFRAGIAYPLRARIDGRGTGAVRYCEFTTGTFVEPIETWDEPRLLRFGVTSSPPPMRELSPYGAIEPRHLHGFLVSQRGQFALRPLPGGRTEVTGTTWYQHHLRPAIYWTAWSDAIIHRIHLRVLRHIEEISERERTAAAANRRRAPAGATPPG